MSQLPIVIPHDPAWESEFLAESAIVARVLELETIHHIGSTSIAGIYAKPIIDMLGEATSVDSIDRLSPHMIELGYEAMGEFGIPGRRYFRKNVGGVRKFHLHVFKKGSEEALRHLRFRDYLRSHPKEAKEYSDLKRELARTCEGDSDKYMDGKDAFIKEIDRKAAEWAVGRK